jgi:hypothetical protein
MATPLTILNNTIGLVNTEARNVNGISGVTYYFSRKTVDSNLPIEVSFVMYDGEIKAVSKQLTNSFLESATVNGRESFVYKNDIIFDKQSIEDALLAIEPTYIENNIVEVINSLFGIDLSMVDGIDGFEFDQMKYIDKIDAGESASYFDGNILIFHDISTKTLKMAVYCGELVPFTFQDYLDDINSYGKNRILSEISVENDTHKTTISNDSKFRVKIEVEKYTYSIRNAVYSDKNYTKEAVDTFEIVLNPGQNYELVHQKAQRRQGYTLFNNPISPPMGPIYAMSNDSFASASEYINEEPFRISLKEVLSRVGVFEPNKYITISGFYELFKDKENFARAIVDKSDDLQGLNISNSHGVVAISDDAKFKEFVASGSVGVFANRVKVMFKSKLRRIYSYLGEDQLDMVIDYSISSSRYRILGIQNRVVYNDTISTPQQAFVVTVGVIGNINDIMQSGGTLDYADRVYLSDAPCNKDRESVIRKIVGAELFSSSYLSLSINDVINNPSKKVYSGPMYKTYDGEVDDAYGIYQTEQISRISGFSLVTSNNILSSIEFAEVMPLLNSQSDKSDECRTDFVEKVDEIIDELGIEVSLNEALEKMKVVAYLYRQPEEIVATVTLGMTLDREWFFCGEDFFPYDAIRNPEFTTYMDNEVVSISRDAAAGLRAIYDKKKFLDSNDWGEDYKQYLHDAFMALLVGSVKTSEVYSNPGLKYIVDHLLDSSIKLSESYDEMLMHARESVFSKRIDPIRNTMLMPDIFRQLLSDGKIGYQGYTGDDDTHYFGRLKQEYKLNYADLGTSDAYDSAYEIGHTVDAMMNIEAMEIGATLYNVYGKFMLGVNVGSWSPTDSLRIEKRLNYLINGERYGFAVIIQKNQEDVFAIAYDYKTKGLAINNIAGLEISSYPLLLASFDILLHDYYDTLEGYKRVGLGIYDYYESVLPEGTMSKQYLLINSTPADYTERNLHYVTIGVFDSQIRLSPDKPASSEIIGYYGQEEPYSAHVELSSGGLEISIDGSDTIRYSLSTLSNYPSDRIVHNGLYIQLYRTDKFLPMRYMEASLTRAIISFVGSERSSEDAIEGDLRLVDFGTSKEVPLGPDRSLFFALGGNGLFAWTETSGYSTEPVELVSIDDIMSTANSEIEFSGVSLAIVFE